MALILLLLGALQVLQHPVHGHDVEWAPDQIIQFGEGLDVDDDYYKEHVKLFLIDRPAQYSSGAYVLQVEAEDAQSLLQRGFNASRPTTILVHGYGNDISDGFIDTIAEAHLDSGVAANLLAVDWGALCRRPWYLWARYEVAGVGRRVAGMARALVDAGLVRPADLHLVGHSLGAHVVGNAGKQLGAGTATGTAGSVGRITGLDPALPFFFEGAADRLSRSDARLVDVIHTCGNILADAKPHGHVDFYPNGGLFNQPGCFSLHMPHCSHIRAYELFAESIRNPQAFRAIWCPSYKLAQKQECPDSDIVGRMGMHVAFSVEGPYHLRTRDRPPYSL